MHTILRKLRSENGESIAEVLVATLVVALGSVLFVGMVSASEKIVRNSDTAYDKYLSDHNAIEDYEHSSEENSSSVSISSPDGDNSLEINSGAKQKIKLYHDPDNRYFIYEYDSSGESGQ
ncbi:MAG: hypothetical protein PUA69_01150 [Erysipelotrichaceae bacterium]|nr:hypothetical protein [Erysipelotrichaceae bacterium]